MKCGSKRRIWGARRGHAVIEVALLSPWIFFLFMGTFDMGFFTHALIATENAARAAAAYTSKSSLKADDRYTACNYARAELNSMSNVRNLKTCDANPLIVTATKVTVDGKLASLVSVAYQTDNLIPIPGLPGKIHITRTVQMMVK